MTPAWKNTKGYHKFFSRVCFSPTEAHLQHLADNLRREDIAEIDAATGGGLAPRSALEFGVQTSSIAGVVLEPDKQTPMAIFGAGSFPEHPAVGFVWMHGTPALERFKYDFLRLGRYGVALLQEKFALLTGAADSRNALHLRWLSWNGFTFINTYPLIPGGPPFMEFVLLGGPLAIAKTLNKGR